MKPYQQSKHQVGYQPPPSTEVSKRLLVWTVLSVVVLLVLLNVVFPEPESSGCAAPAQVANQK